jgi:hypothetical protein
MRENFFHKRSKNDSFSDALFRTLTVAPSVGRFSKLATKLTKPIIVLSPSINYVNK